MTCEITKHKAVKLVKIEHKKYSQSIWLCAGCLKDMETGELTHAELHIAKNSSLY